MSHAHALVRRDLEPGVPAIDAAAPAQISTCTFALG